MAVMKCPRCATHVRADAGTTPVCPSCGFGAPSRWAAPVTAPPGPPQAAPQPQPHPHYGPPPVYSAARVPPTEGTALAALLVNLLFWPGIGTLIGGRTGEGIAQLLLWLLAFLLVFTIIGIIIAIPLWIGVYIWGIVSGAQLMGEAQRAKAPAPQSY